MRRRVTIEEVRAGFAKKGLVLLETEFVSARAQMRFMCPVHGERSMTWQSVQKGRGCLLCAKERPRERTRDYEHLRIYSILAGMKERCYNPNSKAYRYYGAKGITVCDEWRNDSEAFRVWALSNGYRDDLTIDRVNPAGNYEPSNCRWATCQEQGDTKSNNINVTAFGKTQNLNKWAKELGILQQTLLKRYNYGDRGEHLLRPIDERFSYKKAVNE